MGRLPRRTAEKFRRLNCLAAQMGLRLIYLTEVVLANRLEEIYYDDGG